MKKVNSDCVFCSYNLLIIVVISMSTITILNIRLMLMKLSEIIQKHFFYEHDMFADDNDGESDEDDNGEVNLL